MRIVTKFAGGAVATVAVAVGMAAAVPAEAAAPVATTKAVAVQAKPAIVMVPAASRIVPGKLRIDRRCMTGRAFCVNKTTRKVTLLLNGKPLKTTDVRFGCRSTPTREGAFKVYRKSRHHVSSQYHSPMPWAMFFSGGQALHYSSDFAARGYGGCSHGCANIRSKSAISYMYARAPIGTKVIVYRS